MSGHHTRTGNTPEAQLTHAVGMKQNRSRTRTSGQLLTLGVLLTVVPLTAGTPSATATPTTRAETSTAGQPRATLHSQPTATPATRISTIRAGAMKICRNAGFTEGAKGIWRLRSDFTGDGSTDVVAGFTCPDSDGNPQAMLYFWPGNSRSGTTPRPVDTLTYSRSVTGMRVMEGQVEVETVDRTGSAWRLYDWQRGRWVLTYEDAADSLL